MRVKWESKTIELDVLSQAAKNSLGSVLTVFRVDQWGSDSGLIDYEGGISSI